MVHDLHVDAARVSWKVFASQSVHESALPATALAFPMVHLLQVSYSKKYPGLHRQAELPGLDSVFSSQALQLAPSKYVFVTHSAADAARRPPGCSAGMMSGELVLAA